MDFDFPAKQYGIFSFTDSCFSGELKLGYSINIAICLAVFNHWLEYIVEFYDEEKVDFEFFLVIVGLFKSFWISFMVVL